jgi:hypothetical protein
MGIKKRPKHSEYVASNTCIRSLICGMIVQTYQNKTLVFSIEDKTAYQLSVEYLHPCREKYEKRTPLVHQVT